jgi:hypothetical protein
MLLVGTRKGCFLLESDGDRRDWDVRGPLRPLLVPRGMRDRDQPLALQAVDGLVNAGPLPDIDALVLATLLDELLHAIRVHGRLVQEPEHGQGQRRAAMRAAYHNDNTTSKIITMSRASPP